MKVLRTLLLITFACSVCAAMFVAGNIAPTLRLAGDWPSYGGGDVVLVETDPQPAELMAAPASDWQWQIANVGPAENDAGEVHATIQEPLQPQDDAFKAEVPTSPLPSVSDD